jgi:hypothetical protein
LFFFSSLFWMVSGLSGGEIGLVVVIGGCVVAREGDGDCWWWPVIEKEIKKNEKEGCVKW